MTRSPRCGPSPSANSTGLASSERVHALGETPSGEAAGEAAARISREAGFVPRSMFNLTVGSRRDTDEGIRDCRSLFQPSSVEGRLPQSIAGRLI